jgi:hypothetical protein
MQTKAAIWHLHPTMQIGGLGRWEPEALVVERADSVPILGWRFEGFPRRRCTIPRSSAPHLSRAFWSESIYGFKMPFGAADPSFLPNEVSVDLQVRLQFEFEAGLGGDFQMLLTAGRNDETCSCSRRHANECAFPTTGDAAD